MQTFTCPKCTGKMEKGSFSGNNIDWQKETDKSFLVSSGKEILTYACTKCGYLESYVQKK